MDDNYLRAEAHEAALKSLLAYIEAKDEAGQPLSHNYMRALINEALNRVPGGDPRRMIAAMWGILEAYRRGEA